MVDDCFEGFFIVACELAAVGSVEGLAGVIGSAGGSVEAGVGFVFLGVGGGDGEELVVAIPCVVAVASVGELLTIESVEILFIAFGEKGGVTA